MFKNWLFQTCTIFKKIHDMYKHHPMVVFHIFLQNVYSFFEQYKTLFVNFSIHPSSCHPFSYFINCLFHFVPHVLISSKFLTGFTQVGSLGYSKGFVVILHILSSMFEFNVYSIIVSKVFSVTILVNFLFAIVK